MNKYTVILPGIMRVIISAASLEAAQALACCRWKGLELLVVPYQEQPQPKPTPKAEVWEANEIEALARVSHGRADPNWLP